MAHVGQELVLQAVGLLEFLIALQQVLVQTTELLGLLLDLFLQGIGPGLQFPPALFQAPGALLNQLFEVGADLLQFPNGFHELPGALLHAVLQQAILTLDFVPRHPQLLGHALEGLGKIFQLIAALDHDFSLVKPSGRHVLSRLSEGLNGSDVPVGHQNGQPDSQNQGQRAYPQRHPKVFPEGLLHVLGGESNDQGSHSIALGLPVENGGHCHQYSVLGTHKGAGGAIVFGVLARPGGGGGRGIHVMALIVVHHGEMVGRDVLHPFQNLGDLLQIAEADH